MRAALLVVALASCNRVFGLTRTELPPPDAPPSCPALGTLPQFARELHQSVFQACDYLSVSRDSGMAMAECFEPMSFIGYGPIDGELAVTAIDSQLRYPQLAPEGDRAYLWQSVGTAEIAIFSLAGTTWTRSGQIAVDAYVFTPPSRSPRHMIVVTRVDRKVHELVEDASGWTDSDSFTLPAMGVDDISGATLTADGLHLLLYATPIGSIDYAVLYADRASVDQRFGTAQPLLGVPPVYDPFMTEDCGRIYFSASDLQQVLYLQQQ
jgi:hypothetical protein